VVTAMNTGHKAEAVFILLSCSLLGHL